MTYSTISFSSGGSEERKPRNKRRFGHKGPKKTGTRRDEDFFARSRRHDVDSDDDLDDFEDLDSDFIEDEEDLDFDELDDLDDDDDVDFEDDLDL